MTYLENLESRVVENLYFLEKGIRDCALMECGNADKNGNIPEEVDDMIHKRLSTHSKIRVVFKTFECDDGLKYIDAFFYKYNYQRILIEKLHTDIPIHSFLYEYCLGTLLGYSNASMEEFLMRNTTEKLINTVNEAKNQERCCNQCSAE
jgi:hypothetical protein